MSKYRQQQAAFGPKPIQRDVPSQVTAVDTDVAIVSTPLAIVPPPPKVASVRILADRLEYENCTLKLTEYIFDASGKQIKELRPEKIVVAHGMIIVEEFKLSFPAAGILIRL